jgi:DNA-directed RNA polymerase II subunit RPB1
MYPYSSASRKRTASYDERPPSYTHRPIREYAPESPTYTSTIYDVNEERDADLMCSLRPDGTFGRNSPSPPPNRYNPQAPPYTPASPRYGPQASPYMPTYGPQTGPISKYEPRAPAYSPEMDPKSVGYVPYTERKYDSSSFSPSYGPSFPSYTPVRRDTDRPDFDLREDLDRIHTQKRASHAQSIVKTRAAI